jgi:hypothetical protein
MYLSGTLETPWQNSIIKWQDQIIDSFQANKRVSGDMQY